MYESGNWVTFGGNTSVFAGNRHRKKVYAEYEDDSQKYTATTTMTLIKQTKSETQ